MVRARSTSLVSLALLASVALDAAARAQQVLLEKTGLAANDSLGAAVAFGPDVDGDGFREIAVGSTGVDHGLTDCGVAYILSGRDFSILATIYGDETSGFAGRALCWCGDVDGDGMPDLAIGQSGATGKVLIYSIPTVTKVREIVSANPGVSFGSALDDAGDANGDGIDDLLVGAPGERFTSGAMYLYSGADGSNLLSIQGDDGSKLGYSVAGVGDVNGDGIGDLAGGAPWHASGNYPYIYLYGYKVYYTGDYSGAIQIFSGADGSKLYDWRGKVIPSPHSYYPYYGDYLGRSVGSPGDIDGDGVPDVFGAAWTDVITNGAYIEVHSGATGATLKTFAVPLSRQWMAAAIADVDGDGLPDFLSALDQSEVFLFSSIDGKVLWETTSPPPTTTVSTVVGAAGDGPSRFLLGNTRFSVKSTRYGSVELRGIDDLWLDIFYTHFPHAGDPLTLRANLGPPGNPAALLLTGVNGTTSFTFLTVSTFDGTGSALLGSASVPPGLSGTTLTLRALAIGASGHLVESSDETLALQ